MNKDEYTERVFSRHIGETAGAREMNDPNEFYDRALKWLRGRRSDNSETEALVSALLAALNELGRSERELKAERLRREYLADCAAVIVGAPCCEPYLLEKAREINALASG